MSFLRGIHYSFLSSAIVLKGHCMRPTYLGIVLALKGRGFSPAARGTHGTGL
jgi:hypothetical protein